MLVPAYREVEVIAETPFNIPNAADKHQTSENNSDHQHARVNYFVLTGLPLLVYFASSKSLPDYRCHSTPPTYLRHLQYSHPHLPRPIHYPLLADAIYQSVSDTVITYQE